jgi:hypothetical protein
VQAAESAALLRGDRSVPGPRVNAGQAQGSCVVQPRLSGPAGRRPGDQARIRLDEGRLDNSAHIGARRRESMALQPASGCLHRGPAPSFAEGRDMLEQSLRSRHRKSAIRRAIGPDSRQSRGALSAAEGVSGARGRAPGCRRWPAFVRRRTFRGRVGFTLTTASVYANAGDYGRGPTPATRRLAGVAAHPWQSPRDRVGTCHAQRVFSHLGQPTRPSARWPEPVISSGRSAPSPG